MKLESEHHVTVQNNLRAGKRGERLTIGIGRGLSNNEVRVWGDVPIDAKGFGARLSVHNPSLWAAKLFLKALQNRGIDVRGSAQSRDARVPPTERFDPATSTELASAFSKPLGEIVKNTNKASMNLYAELILRTLGRERGGLVSTPDPVGRERGDDEAGLEIFDSGYRGRISHRAWPFTMDPSSRLNLVTRNRLPSFSFQCPRLKPDLFFGIATYFRRDGTLGGRSESRRRLSRKRDP